MKKEDIALHLGAKYKNKAAVEEGVLAAISGIGRKKR